MPTKFNGDEEERAALDVLIKLSRATDTLQTRVWKRLAKSGLTPSQFGVLETLYHLGKLKPSELAAKHLKSRNNLTLVIVNLEREGLVSRQRSAADRRSIEVELTTSGRRLVEELLPVFVGALVTEVSVLNLDEQQTLGGLLRKLGVGRNGLSPK